jgi:hypothetical protein
MKTNTSLGLKLWTIYNSPKDFPGKFIAREWELTGEGSKPSQSNYVTGDTLEEVRKQLPKFMTVIPRHESDDPCIVEVWI